MARIKHTKAIDGNPRGARKQLMLISKLQNRIKDKKAVAAANASSTYGTKKMARRMKQKPYLVSSSMTTSRKGVDNEQQQQDPDLPAKKRRYAMIDRVC